MSLIQDIHNKAKSNLKHIVLPEGHDIRMIEATETILKNNLAKITLLGDQEIIREMAQKSDINIEGAIILDPLKSEDLKSFAKEYYELRKHKGMTEDKALQKMKNPLFYGAMMVRRGIVDGGVAGAVNSTGDVMLAAFHLIGKKAGASVVSSCFAMIFPEFKEQKDYPILFGDCAIIPNPSAEQLADIAISTAKTRKALIGDEPKVAILSFSTKGSASHELVDKVIEATKIAQEKRPDLQIDGELQLDAALVPKVAKSKAPNSKIEGEANVLIFPDLQAGNIGYKLAQRLAGANAFGPLSQGLAKPFNDLSRGCSSEDIINVVAATAVSANISE